MSPDCTTVFIPDGFFHLLDGRVEPAGHGDDASLVHVPEEVAVGVEEVGDLPAVLQSIAKRLERLKKIIELL